jgi:hypothetical protein
MAVVEVDPTGMLVAGYWMILDTGYWILDAGYWMLVMLSIPNIT